VVRNLVALIMNILLEVTDRTGMIGLLAKDRLQNAAISGIRVIIYSVKGQMYPCPALWSKEATGPDRFIFLVIFGPGIAKDKGKRTQCAAPL
jgi:hypothetical protein